MIQVSQSFSREQSNLRTFLYESSKSGLSIWQLDRCHRRERPDGSHFPSLLKLEHVLAILVMLATSHSQYSMQLRSLMILDMISKSRLILIIQNARLHALRTVCGHRDVVRISIADTFDHGLCNRFERSIEFSQPQQYPSMAQRNP